MILTKETMEYFANKGINVRFYPEKTFEAFKQRVYEDEIKKFIGYYKDHVEGCEAAVKGTTNVLYKSMEELQKKAVDNANRSVLKYGNGLSSYDYNTLIIDYDGRTIVKKINQKSKNIDIEFIEKEISKNRKMYNGTYGKFANKVQKLLNNNGIKDNIIIYPTTYGIGVYYIYNWNVERDIKLVADILDRNNIEYYNEFSDERWVYRFKISKKYANIAKIK